MTDRTDQLKREWDERSERLGPTSRAVLFKRFPDWLNRSIHRRHTRFIVRNLPAQLNYVLDVGCGYGRLSTELANLSPGTRFQGVDICTEFADQFERNVGPCFNGPIQEFRSNDSFDLILIITTLMYLDTVEHRQVVQRLWSLLASGGRIVCIEPASELFTLWRRVSGRESASPTGGTVEHFEMADLLAIFSALEGGRVMDSFSVTLLPFTPVTAVHHGVAIEKQIEGRVEP